MKILVLGAGAVGGYFGGRMAQADADVTFLVRPARARLIEKNGLRIVSPAKGDAMLHPKCVTQDQVKPDYDVVILTAKAYDLDNAMDAIAPAMAGGRGQVLPLLNGMAHLDVLDARFGRARVLGGVAYISSTIGPDGEIRHLNDFQRIVFGERDPSQAAVCKALSAALGKVSFDWKHLDNVAQAMWDKWVMLATLAGMTCLMRGPIGDILEAASGGKLMVALLEECAAVAEAEGFATPEAMMKNYRGIVGQKGSQIAASMMRDIESGGPAEGDHVLGALLARARARSVPAPLLEIAATHLEVYAARRRREKNA
ncbi:MAG: ketopantoate reductase family protein [Burkholderiales bacterium]